MNNDFELPKKFSMRVIVFGDGAKGSSFQIARNDELGVEQMSVCTSRAARPITSYTYDFLHDQEFTTYHLLCLAVKRLRPPRTTYEAKVLGVEPRAVGRYAGTGNCYLCRGEWKWSVRVRLGWRATDLSDASSCDACLPATKADPRAAIEARRKWVREHPITLGGLKTDADGKPEDIPF